VISEPPRWCVGYLLREDRPRAREVTRAQPRILRECAPVRGARARAGEPSEGRARIMTMPRADEWRSRGGYFSWRSTVEDALPVEVFHVEMGDPGAPVLLLIHGWPTSSIDWFDVVGQLSARFRVCALDFPGYGFSDKPLGWGYSLSRDEELIEFYLAEVIGAEVSVVVAHDRGDSVALVLHPGRESLPAGRPARRLRQSPAPRTRPRRGSGTRRPRGGTGCSPTG
jgi:Alpha/beta hydrolase family